MGLRLASAPGVDSTCAGIQCRIDSGFDRQVSRLGSRLAQSAFEDDPELKNRISAFTFSVADKREAGTASDADGNVVIYRGVRDARPDEDALAFVIAREMGHVIARHHDEKSAATLLASLLAQLVLPVVNIGGGIGLIASSAVSAIGTRMITADTETQQMQEAEDIALTLLAHQGWQPTEVADSLARYAQALGDDPWSREVRGTAERLDTGGGAMQLALNLPAR
jgi:predicted Zn-dependent protease